MIDRVKGNIAFICDDCDEQLDTETNDFTEARQLMKELGWHIRQVQGQWYHYCTRRCKDKSYVG